jgi:hypothetical protein
MCRESSVLRCMGLLIGSALLLLGTMGSAGADIPPPPDPPNTRRIPATIELDWGLFASRVSRRHVVAKGDTLRLLAARYLGDAKRWQAIAAENPEAVTPPDRIQAGASLWIPPRAASTKDASAEAAPKGTVSTLADRYEAFWTSASGRWGFKIAARASPGEVPKSWQHGGRLLLIPRTDALPILAALHKKQFPTHEQLPASVLHAPLYPDTLVTREDPAVRVVDRFRLADTEQQLIYSTVTRRRYDAQDKQLTDAAPKPRAEASGGASAREATLGSSLLSADLGPLPEDDRGAGEEPLAAWPELVGLIVALVGLLLILGLALFRNRRSSDDPSSTS